MVETTVEAFIEQLNASLTAGLGEGIARASVEHVESLGTERITFTVSFINEIRLDMTTAQLTEDVDTVGLAASVAHQVGRTIADGLAPVVMGLYELLPQAFVPSQENLEKLFEEVDDAEVPEAPSHS